MTAKDLYLKAYDLDPPFSSLVVIFLCWVLKKDESVQLLNGTKTTRKELALKVLKRNSKDSRALSILARSLVLVKLFLDLVENEWFKRTIS
jgi:hypothetical protein